MLSRRLFLGLSAVAALAAACSRKPVPGGNALPAGSTVLAFGDSVTYGTGAGAGESWVDHIAAATGWNVINAGVPGDTAQNGKNRIGALLARHEPQLLIIEMGGNDFLRKRASAQVKEDLRDIIRQGKNAGTRVVLVAVPGMPSAVSLAFSSLSDAPIYEELAREENILLIPDVFSQTLADSQLRADQIHPNAAGYARMAQGMLDALRDAGIWSGIAP